MKIFTNHIITESLDSELSELVKKVKTTVSKLSPTDELYITGSNLLDNYEAYSDNFTDDNKSDYIKRFKGFLDKYKEKHEPQTTSAPVPTVLPTETPTEKPVKDKKEITTTQAPTEQPAEEIDYTDENIIIITDLLSNFLNSRINSAVSYYNKFTEKCETERDLTGLIFLSAGLGLTKNANDANINKLIKKITR